MIKKRIVQGFGLVLMIMLAVVTFSCNKEEAGGDSESASAKPKKKEMIQVGVVLPQTGAYAGFGTGGAFGIEAAVEDINALGGIQVGDEKMLVDITIMDNQSDPNKGGTLAETLITQRNVNFMLSGEGPPPLHPAVSNVCERYKVPYVASCGPFEPWNGLREATDTKWQYTWATGVFALGSPSEEGDFRAGVPGYKVNDTWVNMLEQFGDQTNKKVAVFASDDPDGIGWYNNLPAILEAAGYEPVGIDKKLGFLPAETTDFSSVINEWKAEGAEILWGNSIPPFFAALWKQCQTLGYNPKIASVGRAALFYQDISSWGGDLPNGVGTEVWWTPAIEEYEGIGDTTPRSLVDRWTEDSGQPMNPAVGAGYRAAQVLFDAIERAGTLDGEKVNEALAETDLMTIGHRVKFDSHHFNRTPIVFGQWQPTDDGSDWVLEVIYSKHDFIPETADAVFPIPE